MVALLAAAVIETVPLPDPVPPAVIVSHVALLLAVHAHPVSAVTVIVCDDPAVVAVTVLGETV